MYRPQLFHIVRTAVFTALIIIGTFIRIPFVPVPIVLANFFVVLGGIYLGPLWGSLAVALYLFLGALGLPVFSAGGGAALFLGPTGGYLTGYLFAPIVAGLIARGRNSRPAVLFLAAAAGIVSIYLIGVPWLMWRLAAVTGEPVSLARGMGMGVLPFLPGDAIKIAAAGVVARSLNRLGLKGPSVSQ